MLHVIVFMRCQNYSSIPLKNLNKWIYCWCLLLICFGLPFNLLKDILQFYLSIYLYCWRSLFCVNLANSDFMSSSPFMIFFKLDMCTLLLDIILRDSCLAMDISVLKSCKLVRKAWYYLVSVSVSKSLYMFCHCKSFVLLWVYKIYFSL